ncbi:MAG: hypothetical protein H7A39_00350 [Chlamydiales bacterium]|nr:hypothetical protein [Chlamydiales bacterium]
MSVACSKRPRKAETATSSKKPRLADHNLSMRKIYIHQIREGTKCIEGRIYKGPVKNLKEGRTIRFYYMSKPDDDVVCKITAIRLFANFQDMLADAPYADYVPGAKSQEEAVALYLSIPGYKEKSQTYGVCAIHLEKV